MELLGNVQVRCHKTKQKRNSISTSNRKKRPNYAASLLCAEDNDIIRDEREPVIEGGAQNRSDIMVLELNGSGSFAYVVGNCAS